MYIRQIAMATALYAMLALVGATPRVPTLDAGMGDWHKESASAYGIEPGIIARLEEDGAP